MTLATGIKNIIRIDLGDTTPLGGSLNVSNCGNAFDTKIHVGTGCPSSAESFGCVLGND